MPIVAWHWQERLESADIEGACRQQILKVPVVHRSRSLKLFSHVTDTHRIPLLQVRRSKSYSHWLREKTRANELSRAQDADDDAQDTQAEAEAAFRDWLRRKRRTGKKQKHALDTKDSVQPKPWCKPPSLHVNPKTNKGASRKAERAAVVPHLHQERSEAESLQAYEAWLARVRLEDRIRRAQRRDELNKLEQQQREKHKLTWRKKLAVCAYSTLVV
ncbi:hypothetical protein PHYPSEUDO_006227 [Phytophthora pseudosyringae]|uniref:Uncharacterized protein n=1 Tax=Phytophthora pseudosyringae TaxID=221518 RepID=A0A8T1VMF9_9STRA|nr:hypothetical protein PHYPSEUDO_006227 [Phytophthora pseudosyringae]